MTYEQGQNLILSIHGWF